MKYVVLIGDGMADKPLDEFDGKTPLQMALTPNMDKLAREGTVGLARTIPEGFSPGSDVANLSILGYDPKKYYTGRAPLEAASMGLSLSDSDVAYRCNLVTLKFNKDKNRAFMEDYSAGHISRDEARVLIDALNAWNDNEDIIFYPGVSYRHLMVWKGGEVGAECTAPHDITGKDISDYLPLGAGSEFLREIMKGSVGVLDKHETNKQRVSRGKNPANSIWLWGQGKKPTLPLFRDKYGVEGALVSAVDLTKGLGIYAGLEILDVPGVTGYLDTNYVGKAEYSLEALERSDFVYVHVEAPDEAGHMGNVKDKVKAIEDFDALVVGTVLRGLRAHEEYKVMVLPDHPTPIEDRTHSPEPVPFAIYDSREEHENNVVFSEEIANADGIMNFDRGHELMGYFIGGERNGG